LTGIYTARGDTEKEGLGGGEAVSDGLAAPERTLVFRPGAK
jgi:hypothetical protein